MAAASKASLVLFLASLMVLSLLAPGASAAATCSPTQLTPCAGAIIGNAAPTAACCARIKAHPTSCFCQYKKDPNLKSYVNSPNAKKVFAACKVPLPKC